MLHWDDIKVGDVLRWNIDGLPPLYKIVRKVQDGRGWRVDFFDMQDGKTYSDDYREGTFDYAVLHIPAEVVPKEVLILRKIQYLNERFLNRK